MQLASSYSCLGLGICMIIALKFIYKTAKSTNVLYYAGYFISTEYSERIVAYTKKLSSASYTSSSMYMCLIFY